MAKHDEAIRGGVHASLLLIREDMLDRIVQRRAAGADPREVALLKRECSGMPGR